VFVFRGAKAGQDRQGLSVTFSGLVHYLPVLAPPAGKHGKRIGEKERGKINFREKYF
jgi:hypothetical protein